MSGLPDSDPPFYFRRVWTGATDTDTVTIIRRGGPDGRTLITMDVPYADVPEAARQEAGEPTSIVPDGLVIYGREVNPPTAHDKAHAAAMRARGLVFSECYSVACVEGEVGTHPLAAVTEISSDEFEQARARGWR